VYPEIYPVAWGEGVGGKLRDIDFKIIKSDGQGSYCWRLPDKSIQTATDPLKV
jgi:hypothetical protein